MKNASYVCYNYIKRYNMEKNKLYSNINNQIIAEMQSIDKVKDRNRYNELSETLIRANKKLMYKCADKYKNVASQEDVMQALSIILIRCADHFDTNQNIAFGSYFVRSVSVSLEKTLNHDLLTTHKLRQKSEFKHVFQRMKAEGLNPTQEEVIAKMSIDQNLERTIYNVNHPVSLSSTLGEDDSIMLQDIIPSDESIPDDFDKKEQSYKLHLAVDAMPELGASIITKRFFEQKSVREIAKEYGKNDHTVSVIVLSKLKVLRVLMENYIDELILADNLRKQYAEAKEDGNTFDTDKVVSKMNITNASVIKLIALYNYKQVERKNECDRLIRNNANIGNNDLCELADVAKVVDICVLNKPMAEICAKYQIKPTSINEEVKSIQKRAKEPTMEK